MSVRMEQIIKKFKNLFKADAEFNVQRIPAADVGNSGISYTDLFERKIDALIIEGFYSPVEVEQIKNASKNIDPEQLSGYGGRYVSIPPVFEKFNVVGGLDYFQRSQNELRYLINLTGLDFQSKTFNCMRQFASENEEVTSAPFDDDGHIFPSGCLRIIKPDYGFIRIHADNDFYTGKEDQYKYFMSEVDVTNHVSCIALIQKAHSGGNLVLHDIEFEDYGEITSDMELIHRNTGEKRKLDTFKTLEFKLNEGDLALFSGGQIWHSVSKMEGNTDRITYGGFSAFSRDRKKIYLWT